MTISSTTHSWRQRVSEADPEFGGINDRRPVIYRWSNGREHRAPIDPYGGGAPAIVAQVSTTTGEATLVAAIASSTKGYFEVTLTANGNWAGIGVGIAASDYQLDIPFDLLGGNGPAGTSAAKGILTTFGDHQLGGFTAGYSLPNGALQSAGGWDDNPLTIGCAFDTGSGQVWWVLDPAIVGSLQWIGGRSGGPTPDPTAAVNGCSFFDNPDNYDATADSPITLPLRIVVGAYSLNPGLFSPGDANFAAGTINFGASAFVIGPPTGFTAVDDTGATTLAPGLASSSLTLSNGNLTFTGTAAPATGTQPFYAALSNTDIS